MKYLKSFGALNESNRFLHMKEVLDTLEDLSFDFTDEGFETNFGIMSSQTLHDPDFASFDENLYDIQIKMSSIGKSIIYFKLNLKNMKDQFSGKLNEEEIQILTSTIKSIDEFLKSEEMVISGFWVKYILKRTKYEFKRFNNLEDLLRFIYECNDINNLNNYFVDVRISFMGQPILDESKDFKVDIGLQATESDYEDLKDIIDDFNQNNIEGDNKDFEATIHSKIFGRPVRANLGTNKLNCKAYLVMVDDRSKSYNGFQISDVSDLILRFMSELDSESIMSRIVFIGDSMRENITLTKDDLLNNKPIDPISNLSFYIEIVP